MNKKLILFIFLLAIIGIAGWSIYKSKSNTKISQYIIGCSAPLTGEGANYGRSVKEGVDLALIQINNQKYLDNNLKVVFEDDKMLPKEGVNAVNKLISTNKVPLIIGPFGSSIVLASSKIAERNKTILISASATADAIKSAGDYIFRITPQNSKQGSDIAQFCFEKLDVKKAAIIYQNNDYGVTLKDAFDNKFSSLGGKVVEETGIDLNTTDLKTQLLKIKSSNPDVVFFPLHYQESGLMLKQAKELGLNVNFISADGAMTEDMLKIAGQSAEGAYFSTLALGFGIADNEIEKFNNAFKEKYQKDPDIYNAYYFEVTWLVANALKEGNATADELKAYFYSLKGNNCYNGITGKTCFDINGEVDKSFYIYKVVDGKYELYN